MTWFRSSTRSAYFDLVPEQYEIREGSPDYTGKVCVIGSSLNEEALNSVFGRG